MRLEPPVRATPILFLHLAGQLNPLEFRTGVSIACLRLILPLAILDRCLTPHRYGYSFGQVPARLVIGYELLLLMTV